MKTTTADHKNQFTLCENFKSLSSYCFSWVESQFLALRLWLLQRIAHVKLATHAIQLAGLTNRNIYVGILMISGSLMIDQVYLLFDPAAGSKSDYWNAYYFLKAIDEQLTVVFLCTGFFLLFSSLNRVRYTVLIPLTTSFCRIIYLATVNNNDDFHKYPHWSFAVMGFSIAIVWVCIFNYIMTLHFHKKEGTRARMDGIIDLNAMKQIPDDVAMKILRQERKQLKAFINQ